MRFPARLLAFALAAFTTLAHADVSVSDAWVRATVPGQRTTSAFMTLLASSDAALVGVSSPAAKVVEVHEMKHEGGVMQMRAIERLPLPAGKPVELTPSGYHVMLMSLAQPVKVGSEVPLTLTIEDAAGKRTTLEVKAVARPLAAGAAKH